MNKIEQANIFFGSKEVEANEYFDVINPYNNSVASLGAKSSTNDATCMLELAKHANDENRAKSVPLFQRINWINDVAQQLFEKKEDFAQTITNETAKPISFSRIEVDRAIETLKITSAEAINISGELFNSDVMPSGKKSISYYKRVPVGVVVAITPFNFPLNLVAHKLGPALIMNNTVILKPTSAAPLTAYKFAKLFIESKYAIKDALSVIYGGRDIATTLIKSDIPRKISFTGSVPVGLEITKNAGIKKLSLELGGNAATFIEKSADVNFAAKRCAFGAFANSGQVCISLQRIYVQDEIYEQFGESLKYEISKLKFGSCFDDDTFMSSLINKNALDGVMNWIDSAKNEGAKILTGGEIINNVLAPTLLSEVTDEMKIVCEEAFAPVVSMVRVHNYQEAVEKMNNSPYGLQFSIFTNDLNLARNSIDDFDCGGVIINDIPTLRFDIQPYGGSKLSGIGREGPKYAMQDFTEIKSVVIL